MYLVSLKKIFHSSSFVFSQWRSYLNFHDISSQIGMTEKLTRKTNLFTNTNIKE